MDKQSNNADYILHVYADEQKDGQNLHISRAYENYNLN